MSTPIKFIDLAAQQERLRPQIEQAIAAVLAHGAYVSGPEVAELEGELGAWAGGVEVVGCASGTDALVLALLALGVQPGDAVVVPAFTFAATAEAVALVGATPVFADVHERTYNLDASSVRAVLEARRREGSSAPVGVIAVDLFGLPADYDGLREVFPVDAGWIIADAAQSFGGAVGEQPVGNVAEITATSFFPAKPLGCYGDGGAVFVRNGELADVLRSLRVHGQGVDRYDHVRIGMTGRLDTVQAAVLIQKLTVFADELAARQRVADRYGDALADLVDVPTVPAGHRSAWAQYTVALDGRADVADRLGAVGVPTAIYYPRALPDQPAYSGFPVPVDVSVSRRAATRVLSLPMHPYLSEQDQDRVIDAVRSAVA